MEGWAPRVFLGAKYLSTVDFFSFSTTSCHRTLHLLNLFFTFYHIPFKLWHIRTIRIYIFICFLGCFLGIQKLLKRIFHSKSDIKRNRFIWTNISFSLQQDVASFYEYPHLLQLFLQYKQTRTFLPFVYLSLETCSHVRSILLLVICELVVES